MNKQLQHTINAHGGLALWGGLQELKVKASIGGSLFDLKGQSQTLRDVEIAIDCHAPRVTYAPFGTEDQYGLFEPDRVATMSGEEVREERRSPRDSFKGLALEAPWDLLHLAYFGGYAIWNYLCVPFAFIHPGFQISQGDPWQEADEIWQTMHVAFPPEIPTHCKSQTFYFDSKGLLRRLDYHAEIIGEIPTAHYCSEYRNFGGLSVATQRRAFFRNPDGTADLDKQFVHIDLSDVSLVRKYER